jgi:ribonuclease P protein component
MLPRPQRLTDPRGFARVRQHGRACNHSLLVVTSTPNGGATTRVGFSVSKRVGSAVVRNLVKRRLREAIRPLLPMMSPGLDIVIIARPEAATVPFAALSAALDATLRRARLLRSLPWGRQDTV